MTIDVNKIIEESTRDLINGEENGVIQENAELTPGEAVDEKSFKESQDFLKGTVKDSEGKLNHLSEAGADNPWGLSVSEKDAEAMAQHVGRVGKRALKTAGTYWKKKLHDAGDSLAHKAGYSNPSDVAGKIAKARKAGFDAGSTAGHTAGEAEGVHNAIQKASTGDLLGTGLKKAGEAAKEHIAAGAKTAFKAAGKGLGAATEKAGQLTSYAGKAFKQGMQDHPAGMAAAGAAGIGAGLGALALGKLLRRRKAAAKA
jgi:hypothetical protein